MKKNIVITAAVLSAVMLLGSCSEKKQTATDAVISNIMSDAAAQAASAGQGNTEKPVNTSTAETTLLTDASDNWKIEDLANGETDVDLTQMNSTMIYSVIYDIMINPGDYYGKSIKVNGYFDTMYNEELGARYYFVVVPDATACCVQGLEFILPEGGTYPDDYPEPGTDIRLHGILDSYDEAGQSYTYINVDQMTVL